MQWTFRVKMIGKGLAVHVIEDGTIAGTLIAVGSTRSIVDGIKLHLDAQLVTEKPASGEADTEQ